jgi:hypothetical protein
MDGFGGLIVQVSHWILDWVYAAEIGESFLNEIEAIFLNEVLDPGITLKVYEGLEFGLKGVIEADVKEFHSPHDIMDVEIEFLLDLAKVFLSLDLQRDRVECLLLDSGMIVARLEDGKVVQE